MTANGHTGPRWIKALGDPPGFVKDARTGVFYIRRNFSPGPGQKPKQVVRSLRTKMKAEALKRFDIEAGNVRLGIEKGRPRTLRETVACQTARNRDPLSAPNRAPSFPRISGEARSPQQAQSVAAG